MELVAIWSSLREWLEVPVGDVAPEDDWRFFHLSYVPEDFEERSDAIFAGTPPAALPRIALMCMEFGREFSRRVGSNRREGMGGAGMTLWYPAGPAWAPLQATEDWIDEGPSTPHLDWSGDGRHTASFTASLESAPALRIAATETALALTIHDYRCGPSDIDVTYLARN